MPYQRRTLFTLHPRHRGCLRTVIPPRHARRLARHARTRERIAELVGPHANAQADDASLACVLAWCRSIEGARAVAMAAMVMAVVMAAAQRSTGM